MTLANLVHLLLGAVLASVSQAIKARIDLYLARRLAAMGLSAHTKNALKIALPHQAANEVIPLLDRLSDELDAEKRSNEARAKVKADQPKPDEPVQVVTPAPAATQPAPTGPGTPSPEEPADPASS